MPIIPTENALDMATRGNYLIRVQGNVGVEWLEYFNDISIVLSAPPGDVPVSAVYAHRADQADVIGILTQLYTFGYPLVSLEYLGLGFTVVETTGMA